MILFIHLIHQGTVSVDVQGTFYIDFSDIVCYSALFLIYGTRCLFFPSAFLAVPDGGLPLLFEGAGFKSRLAKVVTFHVSVDGTCGPT
jgi:hypothetical protein